MSTNTLEVAYANGSIIDASHVNELTLALLGDLVGRDANGIPVTSQNLGTLALPWGTAYINNLILNGQSVDVSLLAAPQNRIVSGKTRSSSNQPQFLKPNGAAASFILEGLTTNLVLDVDGVTATVNTDITKTGLTVGPTSANTCAIADVDAADQISTRLWGEKGSEKETIAVDAMGASFLTEVGQYKIISIAGVTTEYALAFIKSSTELTDVLRGWFTNSSDAPVNRSAFFDNELITVLSTGWVFVEDNGTTVDISYTTPIESYTAPSSPSVGDYWKDLGNGGVWKRHSGASWELISRTLVGVVGIDSTNCVCARSFDFYAKHNEFNSAELGVKTTEIIEISKSNAKVSILGNDFDFGFNSETWNITNNLAASADMYNAAEQSSTKYFAYISDEGETIISDIEPHYRQDLKGEYHPHNPWRCVGEFLNDSSSDIVHAESINYSTPEKGKSLIQKKYLTSDLTTNNSDISDLKCFNLELGVEYTVKINLATTMSSNHYFDFTANNNGAVVGEMHHHAGVGKNHNEQSEFTFIAAASTLIFSFTEGTTITIFGNSTDAETWIELKENKVKRTTKFDQL